MEAALAGSRTSVALLSAGTYHRIRDLRAEFGDGVYVGALFEVGNAWPAGVRRSLNDLHRSVTAVIGAQTLIGPVLFGYGRAETGDDRFYLTIGKTF